MTAINEDAFSHVQTSKSHRIQIPKLQIVWVWKVRDMKSRKSEKNNEKMELVYAITCN